MSGLREAAERIAAMGRLPTPRRHRALAIEQAGARLIGLAAAGRREAEPWDDFLVRIGVIP